MKHHSNTTLYRRLRYGLALQLSCVAGFVDAIGYIALYHVYVANMSGNTIAIAVEPTQGKWDLFFRRGAAVPFFVFGMLLSKCAVHWTERQKFRYLPAVVYGAEALLLGLFVWLGADRVSGGEVNAPLLEYYFLLALLSLAMGLQNTLHTHFGQFNLHTTHVTGTLAKFTDEIAQFLFWFTERARAGRRLGRILVVSKRQRAFRDAAVLGAVWLCYAGGAFAGALLLQSWGIFSLTVPAFLLVFLAVADVIKPMALAARAES